MSSSVALSSRRSDASGCAATRLGAEVGREEADGASHEGPEDEVEVLRVAEGNMHVYGLEWIEIADMDWGHRLGYSLQAGNVHVSAQRGCVNKEMTHCFAVALLQALSSIHRVKVWCKEHSLCCRRQSQDTVCVLCD